MNETKLRSMQSVLEAASIAGYAHQGQLRKDHKTPYVCHLFRVCLILRELFGFDDPRMLITALLHDTIEDTLVDFDDLEAAFDGEVAQWVSLLTKDKRLPESKREKAYLAKLARAPWQVKACKLADLCDNMLDASTLPKASLKKSRARYDHYWKTFRNWSEPQLKKPLEITARIMAEMGGVTAGEGRVRGTAAGDDRDPGPEADRSGRARRPGGFARQRRREDVDRLSEEGTERGVGAAAPDDSAQRAAPAARGVREVLPAVTPF